MDYVIEPQDGKKGRSFRATSVAMVTATALTQDAGSDNIRPIWAMFAGTESELRPFMTNLRLGRKANVGSSYRNRANDRIEFLKSGSPVITWQKEKEGCLATIFDPDLFRLDPGMVDPAGVKFSILVPKDWDDSQSLDRVGPASHVRKVRPSATILTDDELTALVPTAYLFAAYLDRRTRCPLIADGKFYLQILHAALENDIATLPGSSMKYGRVDGIRGRFGFNAVGLEDVGISQAIAFCAGHESIEKFLAEEVAKYFKVTGNRVHKVPKKNPWQCDLFPDV